MLPIQGIIGFLEVKKNLVEDLLPHLRQIMGRLTPKEAVPVTITDLKPYIVS